MNSEQLLGKLSPFANKKILIAKNQDVPDIMSAILNAHKIYSSEYDKICSDFYCGSALKTAKCVFDFLKRNVRYVVESENNQRIISPAGIISLKNNDCKNFSLFCVGILDACRRKGYFKNKSFFRFASYRLLDEIPHHVFAVLIDDNGDEVFVDPVLPEFNDRKLYFHKIDKMPLYSISGVGVVGATAKPKKKIVLKIALAPVRGAFLLLVGLNFLGKATKLKQAFDNHADKVQAWWINLGGNPNELLKKVEQGAKKKRLLGDEISTLQCEGIGVVATATATASITAAPILIKLATFLKDLGIDAEDIAETGKTLLAKTISSEVKKVLNTDEQIQQQQQTEINQAIKDAESDQPKTASIVNNQVEKTDLSKYIPYVAGGIIVLLVLSKKK